MGRGVLELMAGPSLVTELPGPRAREILAIDRQHVSPSYTRSYPLVAKRAQGAIVEDVDGNRFLDFTAGIAVVATGHCHPQVVEAVQKQAGELIHMSGSDFYYEGQARLAQKLAQLAPGSDDKKVFFSNSGTEAVEAALKLARHATGRDKFIAFTGAFHGRTMGSLSLTASKAVHRRRFGPLIPGVFHVPYANCYRCAYNQTPDTCAVECATAIEKHLFPALAPPEEVAAIVVEPVQGEGGYIVPPPKFLEELRRIATENGILLVADEVQSGMGRTGKMFACQHAGVEPDILCLAKGIASGMPLGATITSPEIMSWPPGAHASTFGGNPVSIAAALATIELLEQGLIENAAHVGAQLLARVKDWPRRYPQVGDVRGVGLLIGIELVKDLATKDPAPQWRDAVVQQSFHKGLLLLGCGKSTLRLAPPLVITRAQGDFALDRIEESLQALPAS